MRSETETDGIRCVMRVWCAREMGYEERDRDRGREIRGAWMRGARDMDEERVRDRRLGDATC